MKKLFPIILLLVSLNITAQHKHKERIKALKVSFITEKLDLSAKEAQAFWPVYNEYSKAKVNLRDKFKGSDDADAMVKQKEEEASLLKSYNEKFKEILPNEKVSLLHKAESELKKKILEEIKKRNAETK